MAPIVNNLFNDQKIVLTRPFFAQEDHQEDRDLHSHSFIEFSYVTSGSADHVLLYPNGEAAHQKLSLGNYMLLDTSVRHAYKNCTADFSVLNLLFKQPFLKGDATELVKGLSLTRSVWKGGTEADTVELYVEAEHPVSLKKQKYLRLWLDLRGEGTPLDFAKASIGVVVNGDRAHPHTLCRSSAPFYCIGEASTKWEAKRCGADGCIGLEAGSSLRGFCGWLAFPVGELKHTEQGDDRITGVVLRYRVSEAEMAGVYLHVNDVQLVRDYLLPEDTANSTLINFDKDVFRVGVSGQAEGSNACGTEEIKVSLFDSGDLSALIRESFPTFEHTALCTDPVNRVHFDKDGSICSLFRICLDSSRRHRCEWQSTVRHALSLILVLTLQSLQADALPQKETIIDTVKKHVAAHFAENVTLTDICQKHFYSLPYVSHRFKEVCGCSFEQYVRQIRIKHAGELLLTTTLSMGEIAERCGYASARTFGRSFATVTGLSPLQFKRKQSTPKKGML